jgi:2,4-didehydro-3-deoxy-L-rhamnonate hydrolase
MRLCRFGDNRLGLVRQERVIDVTPVLDRLPNFRYPLPKFDPLIVELDSLRDHIKELADGQQGIPIGGVRLICPIANPGKIVAAPVNYKRHLQEARDDPAIHHSSQIAEIERVGLFLKATSSVIGPSEAIMIRHPDRRTDHEIELAVVIGKKADRVERHQAFEYLAGEERSLRKSVDTYTVLGPWLVTSDELADSSQLSLKLSVNGQARQDANTRDLIIDVPGLIAFATRFYTLMPGDVLLTGTPEGVGPIKPGDVIRSEISQIGVMTTSVEGTAD